MSFSRNNGYQPVSLETILTEIMDGINAQFGTTYTYPQFVGTNFYKYFYTLAQRVQKNEIKTSEIFLKLQQYFDVTNERILRPVVTNPGIIEAMQAYRSDLFPSGILVSVKPMELADRGKINICVDVDDTDPNYAEMRAEIAEIIKDSTVAGAVTEGSESTPIVLSNGQSFDFKYHLPTRIDIGLRLTLTLSENNQNFIESPDDVRAKLLLQISRRYRLGLNFEPEKYFQQSDAPWTSQVLLEWTDDVTNGEIDPTPTWSSTVFDSDFDQLLVTDLSRTIIVEN
jgi:hypothetical protein